MTFTHALSTNNYGPLKFIVSTSAANGTHTTLASALTSASSGDTIYLRDSVTEDVTLKAGVNISSMPSNASTTGSSSLIITGKLSFSSAGTVNISGIQLNTNSDFFLAVTGSAASVVNLIGCYLNCSNNTGISFTAANTSARININSSNGNLGTTGIALISQSSTGGTAFRNTIISNSGGSSTANSCSAGSLSIISTFLGNPITCSGTGRFTAKYSEIDSSSTNTTALTTVSGQTNELDFVRLSSGSATPYSVGGTDIVNALLLHHTNSTAISGAGSLTYSGLFQDSTIGAISVTTIVGKGTVGINNNTAPVAGYIGEILSAVNSGGTATTINTITNISSLTPTAGTWDISGVVQFSYTAGVGMLNAQGAIATANNNFTPVDQAQSCGLGNIPTTGAAASPFVILGPARVTTAGATAYFLNAFLSGTSATISATKGFIRAVRVA